ncbi:hypothetical protein [Streptomyces violaceusniger]|uniref:hypothetical protein n=1 Tax=Streptomyces violaceusniger TaxID=68280 RepID=UPI0036B09D1B
MTVTQVLSALGSWEFTLKTTTPPDLWDHIDYFGHVAFIPGRIDPQQYGDDLLTAARYVGVVRGRDTTGDDRRTKIVEQGYALNGVGMAMWLGDEDDKGSVYENAVEPASATFANTIRALLPASGAVTEGTLYSVPGTYSGRHQYESPRTAISYVCDTFSASCGAKVGWRVNGNGTLDAGPESDLYVTSPRCVISRKSAGKDTSGLESVPGAFGVTRDMEDYSTRVVLLAEGQGESIATGAADISPATPYKDVHGNPLKLTRLASESDTSVTNADTRAELLLSQYTSSQDEITVETDNFYIEGSFDVGDYVWVWDPGAGLVDPSNEITFRGERLNPIKLQITEARWPITEGYTVAYRAADGTWYDLTDHVEWDGSHTVYVTVGGWARALTNAGTEPVGSRPNSDTSVPGAPTFVEPFVGSAYLDGRGFTRARVVLSWIAPNNVDGSTVLDGDHFEIRWAIDTDMIYPATWSQVSQVRWQDLQTWAQPFAAPDGDWQTMFAAWGESTAQLQDLSPGVGYDVQIRAVDKAGNIGAWSPVTTFVASEDNIPPSTPAAPTVAASRIAVQVTHTLGKSSGGTYNLEADLHHLEVHVDYEPTFTPSETTLKAKASATSGMIQAGIPVVVTVPVEETSARYVRVIAVDITGNKSGPSDAATATALLIDDAHISDLTVSKVTAGTITASWVMAGEIKTADTGARARISADGIEVYNAGGTRTLYAEAATGDVSIVGQLFSGTTGRRIEINPTATYLPEIRFYPTNGSDYAFINAVGFDTYPSLGINGGQYDDSGVTVSPRLFLTDTVSLFEIIRADDQSTRGGFTRITRNIGDVGWTDGSSNANYMRFQNDGITRHYGRWKDFAAVDSNEGLFTGHFVINAGTGVAISYGPTMDSFMRPMVTVYDNILHTFGVTAESASSFSVDISPAGSGNWDLNFWVFRTS